MIFRIFRLPPADGVLWDVRTEKEIHKFDKLNQVISGVFHPNGLEVLIMCFFFVKMDPNDIS